MSHPQAHTIYTLFPLNQFLPPSTEIRELYLNFETANVYARLFFATLTKIVFIKKI